MKHQSNNVGLVLICCCAMLVGCSRNVGQPTFEFLKAENHVLENAKLDFRRLSVPKQPIAPVIQKRASPREKIESRQKYAREQAAFFDDLNQFGSSLESLCNQTEAKMASIDAAGVDPEAVQLIKVYERTFGEASQVAIEMKALAQMGQRELHRNPGKELAPALFVGLIEACTQDWLGAAKSALGGVVEVVNRTESDLQEIQVEGEVLQKEAIKFDRDKSNLVTACSEVKTSFSAKYPEFAWSSLFPAPIDNAFGSSP
jgi:hypothetical protein